MRVVKYDIQIYTGNLQDVKYRYLIVRFLMIASLNC